MIGVMNWNKSSQMLSDSKVLRIFKKWLPLSSVNVMPDLAVTGTAMLEVDSEGDFTHFFPFSFILLLFS